MKRTIYSLASLALLMFSSVSMGQTCATPGALTSNLSGSSLSGNTCTGGDGTLANVCDNAQITGATAVYSWTFGGAGTPSGNITVTPTAPLWDTAIFIGNGASCAAATAGFCNSKADTPGNGAETLALAGLNTASTTYYLFISSLAAANTCGPYNVATGTLPVKLQSFSIN